MRVNFIDWRTVGVSVLAVGLAILAGCHADSSSGSSPQSSSAVAAAAPAGATANVVIDTFQFQPKELNVAVGTTVTWTNHDDIRHTVTSGSADKPGGPLAGDLPEKGASYSYTFTTPGEYPYYCTVHTSMIGSVIVK
jgi:plastocyanin